MNAEALSHTNGLSQRLSALSREQFYDVYKQFEWPEKLGRDHLAMPADITTLSGTDVWSTLSDEQKWKLSVCETATLFSNTLNGEKLLVAGLSSQLYSGSCTPAISDYLHHFLDEENKHMIMFGEFCRRYVGRVYPDKKFAGPAKHAPGEELLRFYSLAMIVEAYGDYYNVRAMNDDSCLPLVRAISRVHHVDEARHLSFDRSYLTELAEQHLPTWDGAALKAFQQWLEGFLKMNWVSFYNPAAYRDAGIEDPYAVQQVAMAAPAQKELRKNITSSVAKFLLKTGLIAEIPEV